MLDQGSLLCSFLFWFEIALSNFVAILNNMKCRWEPLNRKSSKWKALGSLYRNILNAGTEHVTAGLKNSGELLRRNKNESLSSCSYCCQERSWSSSLPRTALLSAPSTASALPLPCMWCLVHPTKTGPGVYFHIPLWKILCTKVSNGNFCRK